MKIDFVKTLWGVTAELGNSPAGYAALFKRIKAEGFDGIETPVCLIQDKGLFKAALAASGLFYVAMINTCTWGALPGEVVAAPSQKLVDHVASFETQVLEAKTMGSVFINAHSGCDLWPMDVARAFFTRALEVEKSSGIMICHETHRGRILYNPWQTRDLCMAFPDLKITADLSHFCVVAERVFAESDADWNAILPILARHTRHIHARVGYAQGPQVPDPAAPEYRVALERHEKWWDAILAEQKAQGVPRVTVEPEHGVDGYQHELPWTKMVVADVWRVNEFIRAREKERFAHQGYEVSA